MVPTLGESVSEATVATWFKKEGDSFEADEMLCELETDKVSVEVPAPAAGTLTKILAKEGETVEAGGQLAEMTSGKGALPSPPSPKRRPPPPPRVLGWQGCRGCALGQEGHGRGRPLRRPGHRHRQGWPHHEGRRGQGPVGRQIGPFRSRRRAARPSPADDAAREERVKMTRLRQTIAKRLKDSQNTAAMLTTYNEVDMTEVMALRKQYKDEFEKKHGARLGFMSFFTKACVHALKEVPDVNAEIDGTDVVYKNYVHMGIAAGTPQGLVVPVIRDVDSMSFAEIEKEIGNLGKKARDGQLSMADMQGGTFTISNGGVYGSLMSTPILNAPQSGILGMHKIQDRPMVINGEIKIRPMMYLALSYDHRVVDGKGAVTFLVRVKEALEDPRRMLMDL